MSEQEKITIVHRRFGELQIPSASVLEIESMPGFPHVRRLAVLEHDRCSPFAWLVSLDDPDVAFVVAEPHHFFPDYDPRPAPHHLEALGATPTTELKVLAIATVREGCTALNLAAPILVEPKSGRAIQAILDDALLPIRATLSPAPTRATARERQPAPQIESKPHT